MSLFGSFAKEKHLEELATPLPTAQGVITPLVRRQRALANLGLTVGIGGPLRIPMATPATATNTATLTAAQLLNGTIVATPTAAAAYTLPLASALVTALPADFQIGEAFEFTVINVATGATFDITMTTNTGWTLVGNMIVDANEVGGTGSVGVFRVLRTAAATFTLYRMA